MLDKLFDEHLNVSSVWLNKILDEITGEHGATVRVFQEELGSESSGNCPRKAIVKPQVYTTFVFAFRRGSTKYWQETPTYRETTELVFRCSKYLFYLFIYLLRKVREGSVNDKIENRNDGKEIFVKEKI